MPSTLYPTKFSESIQGKLGFNKNVFKCRELLQKLYKPATAPKLKSDDIEIVCESLEIF